MLTDLSYFLCCAVAFVCRVGDIHAELSAYLQGTRLGLCRSFWQWVHENQAMPTYDDELEAHAKADPGLGPNGLLRPTTTMLLRRVFWLRGSPGIGQKEHN